jgi:hypothetical protein
LGGRCHALALKEHYEIFSHSLELVRFDFQYPSNVRNWYIHPVSDVDQWRLVNTVQQMMGSAISI